MRHLHERLLELTSDPALLHEVTADGPDGRCVETNDAACRLLGYGREELSRLTLRDLSANGESPFGSGDAATLLGGAVVTRQTRLRARDGRTPWQELRSALVEDARGRTLALSVLRDLAPRSTADDPQQGYLALLQMAPDAILITGDAHRIVFWNRGAEATYGWSEEEALGRVPRELLRTRDHVPRLHHSVGATLEERGSWEGEVTHTRKDGREIRVASRWRVHRDAQGRLLGILGINRDITEQLKARERVGQLLRIESSSRLAAGVAHEFANRLSVILSSAEELRARLPPAAPELRELAEEILVAGTISKQLTRRLLALAHERPATAEPSDLNEVVRRCERDLRETLPGGLELVVSLEPSLWTVTCDAAGVERALSNLVLNARDAMPGGGRLTLASDNVEVGEELVTANPFMRRGPHVRLTIADSGVGMTPRARAHAFEPFFTTKPQGRGLGLGLATAYGIIKQSGGYILLESEPGYGTRVHLYFPRTEPPPGPDGP